MKRILMVYIVFRILFIPIPCFSVIKPKIEGEEIVIKPGDTLWDLAGKYYDNPFLWPKFFEFNYISDPHWIYPGERLVIRKSLAKELADVLREKVGALEAEREDLVAQIAKLKAEIEKLKREAEKERDALKKKVKEREDWALKREAEIEVIENEILRLQDEVLAGEEERARLRVEIASLEQSLKEKEEEIERKKERLLTLEDELYLKDEEIRLLRVGMFELEEKIAEAEAVICEKEREIEKLNREKSVYTGLAHFLIFALASGIVALQTLN